MIGLTLLALGGCTCSKGTDEGASESKPSTAKTTASTSTTEATTPAPTPNPTPMPTPTPIANAPPAARPRYLRKQRPDDVQASTSTDLARAAFDGDRSTAWVANEPGGVGAWIEARWYSPHGVWSVVADTGNSGSIGVGVDGFAQGAHAKRVHIKIGDDDLPALDVPADERSVAFEGFALSTQRVRFVIDDAYPGTMGSPLALTEISILADASQFPSVPESMVQAEVKSASSRRDVAAILHRFGVNPNIDRGGEVQLMQASLVDRLGRERVLVVSVVGPPDASGLCDEDDHLVFLATTNDDRLISLGSDSISTKTRAGAPVQIDLRAFHTGDVDDVVATWSACSATAAKACHGLRVWTMQRGFPERILDVTSDDEPKVGEDGAGIAVGGVFYAFDPKSFTYH